METKVFVGVDVSKDSLDVAIGPEKDIITFANDQKGVDALVKKLCHRPIPTRLILELLTRLKPAHNIGNRVNGIDLGGKFEYLEFGYLQ
jgi:hypothetical protein